MTKARANRGITARVYSRDKRVSNGEKVWIKTLTNKITSYDLS